MTTSRPCQGDHGASRYSCARRGFTLVEVLVVIGVIAVLVGVLIPVISAARRHSRDVTCASNMRQICLAIIAYAGQNKGAFPPNSGETGQFWYLESVIGDHINAPHQVGRAGAVPPGAPVETGLAGGVFVCPNDLDDSVRSYSMNLYASGDVSSRVRKVLSGPHSPGRLFSGSVNASASSVMLLLESWPELPVQGTSPTKYVAQAVVGLLGRPGERFGAGKGVNWKTPPDATAGRFPDRDSQITFYRHDPTPHALEQPVGRANFGFVDGHVAMLRQEELVTGDKYSSYLALWSANDPDIDRPPKTASPPGP